MVGSPGFLIAAKSAHKILDAGWFTRRGLIITSLLVAGISELLTTGEVYFIWEEP